MKVKHLIKKLQELDPDANIYFGEFTNSKPVYYLFSGTRLKREGIFMSTEEVIRLDSSSDATDRSLVDHLLKRYGNQNRADLHGKDVLISNWNGKWY
jgi:hypothetical protein